MPDTQDTQVALLGPAAAALEAQLRAQGFVPAGDGRAAAVIDLSAPDRDDLIALARQLYAPLVGIVAEGAPADRSCDELDGFVRAPHAATDLPRLLSSLIRATRDRDELLRQSQDLVTLCEVAQSFAASDDPGRLLHDLVRTLAGRLSVERCTLLVVSDDTCTVVAASDDRPGHDRRVDLARYPELREAVRSRRPVLIDDARHHPLLDPVRAHIQGAGVSSIAVVPMLSQGAVVGMLVARSKTRAGFAPREVAFLSTVASATSVALRTAGPLPGSHAQEVLARIATERELSQLRRYEDMFSHVSDGMAVLDGEGRILSINPAGCATLGVLAEEARGLRLEQLVAPLSEMAASLVWREIARGGRVLSADLELQTRDGRDITLSLSAGQLGAQNARAVLSFRDVTESRALEAELRQTKEFLEQLIDAAVDGIVAVDLRGRVLLWNRGAERVTGYSAADAVGKMHVSDFYPPGQAQEIMVALRSARSSARELSPLRVELVARSGEAIPVRLSVAMIAEAGRETATVGIFRDLRDDLRVEAELQGTRERLAIAEKAAVVSELAGAAAHELNQPLTSVLGFSELLFRRIDKEQDQRGREELGVILREAERMARIVRKIGKITRYETAHYVGELRIVDLDRSSEPPPPMAPLAPDDKP